MIQWLEPTNLTSSSASGKAFRKRLEKLELERHNPGSLTKGLPTMWETEWYLLSMTCKKQMSLLLEAGRIMVRIVRMLSNPHLWLNHAELK